MKLFSSSKNIIVICLLIGICFMFIIYFAFNCALYRCIDPGNNLMCDEKCQEECLNTKGFQCGWGEKILDFTFQKP